MDCPTTNGHAGESRTRATIGRYVVLSELGRGSMGTVLRAYDPKLGRELALKILPRESWAERDEQQVFDEAWAMAKVSHPNVLAIYDVELTADAVVMAMELVDGTTLQQWLEHHRTDGRSRRVDWRLILEKFRAAGAGLAAAHAAGLLHSDFKPSNVLVAKDGSVRVGDFGLARSAFTQDRSEVEIAASDEQDVTQWGVLRGTLRYMAPEPQLRGELDTAADQYAYCVSLWEALVGAPPFTSETPEALLAQKLKGAPPWPREVALPRGIVRAVRRGLAAEPHDRWPSMQSLTDALAAATVKHRGVGLVAVSVCATLAATGTAWAGWQQGRARCTGAGDHLREAWNPELRAEVQA